MSTMLIKLTADDLETFPDDGNRYEIIDGELTVSPSPNRTHQRILGKLFRLVGDDVEDRGVGWAYQAPVDVQFAEPDQVQPDMLVLLKEREPMIYRGHTVFGAPDLVVEVISPSSRAYDTVAKFRLYERNGVPEYWLIDPDHRVIHQFVLVDGVYAERTVMTSLQSTSIPGLVVNTSKLFAVLDQ